MVKGHHLLLAVSLGISLVSAAVLVWLVRPLLLDLPADMRVVQLDRKVPAFFPGVFRDGDLTATGFTINDPLTGVRGRPLLPELHGVGPHDLLGFRNRAVPRQADVVALGDSQTYGNNVLLPANWPSIAARALAARRPLIYSMAVGGWSALQAVSLIGPALALEPFAVVVAFYTGNDPLEDFKTAYSIDYWRQFRPATELSLADMPAIPFPPDPHDRWEAVFGDGSRTVFTPGLRLLANDRGSRPVKAGLEIMARAAREVAARAKAAGSSPIFTIIPSKELVYARKTAGLEAPDVYARLIRDETANIAELRRQILSLPGTRYVDLLPILQAAAETEPALYPQDENGHPAERGYALIGETIGGAISDLIPVLEDGAYRVQVDESKVWYYLLRQGELFQYADRDACQRAGWSPDDIPDAKFRVISRYPLQGKVTH